MAIRCQVKQVPPTPTDAIKQCTTESSTCPGGPAVQGFPAAGSLPPHIDSHTDRHVPTQHAAAGGFEAEDAAGFSRTAAAGFNTNPDVPNAAGCGSSCAGGASQMPENDFEDSWGVQPIGVVCDAFDFSDLTSSLAAAAQQHQQHQQKLLKASKDKNKQPADTNLHSSRGNNSTLSSSRGSAGPLVPEFYLYSEEEPGETFGTSVEFNLLYNAHAWTVALDSCHA